MQRKVAQISLATTMAALVVLLSVMPFTVSAYSTQGGTSQGCNVNWSSPYGIYTEGETITASVTTNCSGSGAWLLCHITPPQLLKCVSVAGHGTFSCPCPNGITLFSEQLQAGYYLFIGVVGSHIISSNWNVAIFEVVTPQFPAGVITAIVTPIAALGGYWFLGKKRQPSI